MLNIRRHVFILCCVCILFTGCSESHHSGSNADSTSEYTTEEKRDRDVSRINNAQQSGAERDTKNADNTSLPKKDKNHNKSLPGKKDMVLISDYISDIYIDLKYATEDNFTGKKIYDSDQAYLRYGTVVKLKKVQNKLKKEGLALLIWDAYRPVKAQYRLWKVCPDSRYVADPNKGYSSHSRGNTVDVTMVSSDGKEIKMPTGFDDFSSKADRDYSDCTAEEAENARKLENLMKKAGFRPYQGEWWHFSDSESYPVKESVD